MIKLSKKVYLTPGNLGRDCLANGNHDGIARHCSKCKYVCCCTSLCEDCSKCEDKDCPNSSKNAEQEK